MHILFCIYVDNLFQLIKTKGIGCHIGSHFCGAFGYADDIILLSPSVNGLQSMLDSYNDFATRYKLKFNSSKSKGIMFSRNRNTPNVEVYLDGVILEQMNHINHLGHILSQNLSDDKDILLQISMYNRKANTVLSDFRGISGELRVNIMRSYCSSFYGSQMWDLSNKHIEQLLLCCASDTLCIFADVMPMPPFNRTARVTLCKVFYEGAK